MTHWTRVTKLLLRRGNPEQRFSVWALESGHPGGNPGSATSCCGNLSQITSSLSLSFLICKVGIVTSWLCGRGESEAMRNVKYHVKSSLFDHFDLQNGFFT